MFSGCNVYLFKFCFPVGTWSPWRLTRLQHSLNIIATLTTWGISLAGPHCTKHHRKGHYSLTKRSPSRSQASPVKRERMGGPTSSHCGSDGGQTNVGLIAVPLRGWLSLDLLYGIIATSLVSLPDCLILNPWMFYVKYEAHLFPFTRPQLVFILSVEAVWMYRWSNYHRFLVKTSSVC